MAVGQDWRVDSARVRIGGVRHRRARVLFDGDTVRAFKQDGTVLGELSGARRVPVSAKSWEFRSADGVWKVTVGGCCGDR